MNLNHPRRKFLGASLATSFKKDAKDRQTLSEVQSGFRQSQTRSSADVEGPMTTGNPDRTIDAARMTSRATGPLECCRIPGSGTIDGGPTPAFARLVRTAAFRFARKAFGAVLRVAGVVG
jgi:hypothetical protein